MRHRFHADALTEAREATEFYRAVQPELADAFAREIEAVVADICQAPQRWRTFSGRWRRCLVKRFPYTVLYSIEQDAVFIVAVMHTSRSPGYWRKRIGDR